MWNNYLATLSELPGDSQSKISAWHFCDNEQDANECARLVLEGKKMATSPSIWELKNSGDRLPEVGDLSIITDWYGVAQCIINTTQVDIVPFNRVSSTHAQLEGEGDGSLAYWQKVHWEYYERILKGTEYLPSEDMPVVCETFKVVFPERFTV